MGRTKWIAVLLAAGLLVGPAQVARSCPFCAAVSQTFSEEMESMDVVVLARLAGTPPKAPSSAAEFEQQVPQTPFVITRVLKGEKWAQRGATIETLYFGKGTKDETFLIMGATPPNTMWSTPLVLTPRAVEYVLALQSLPSDHSRLEFFQEYLEDSDEMLAQDAYDEFAKTPYPGVVALKEKINRPKLLKWIADPELPASRKRLYFTMLGVCGTRNDTKLLERLMRSEDRKLKAGLDAMIACYLLLKGPDGMGLVEELFLANPKAEYADTYAAIMALRFHGTEVDVIPKKRLLQALHHMLDRPELADLVIPDLARWEDWEVMPRLVQLFKEADEKSSWVRVPVINYLRACPLPEAQQYIAELEKVDPDAVRRANTFFPFGALSSGGGTAGSTEAEQEAGSAETGSDQPAEDGGGEAKQPQPPSADGAWRLPAAAPALWAFATPARQFRWLAVAGWLAAVDASSGRVESEDADRPADSAGGQAVLIDGVLYFDQPQPTESDAVEELGPVSPQSPDRSTGSESRADGSSNSAAGDSAAGGSPASTDSASEGSASGVPGSDDSASPESSSRSEADGSDSDRASEDVSAGRPALRIAVPVVAVVVLAGVMRGVLGG